ncbi:MAG: class I SAM-dependent methyltransferase [Acidimicrobiia bacterium]
MSNNPFATDAAARLYAAGRPDYSSLVTDVIRRLTGITARVRCAVDVGCGTGISTMALAPLADTIIGVEPSTAMLAQALPAANVLYRVGSAEDLPLEDGSCDLIAVGSALHWFDQARFLKEASRVARPDAWLVVHDHWFTGQMQGHEEFAAWARDVYLSTYPSPPRDRSWRPPDDLGAWQHTGWERYEHPVPLTADQLAAYLLTQSNLQTVIERGDQTEAEFKIWLLAETAPFFADDPAPVFLFGGFVACHQQSP